MYGSYVVAATLREALAMPGVQHTIGLRAKPHLDEPWIGLHSWNLFPECNLVQGKPGVVHTVLLVSHQGLGAPAGFRAVLVVTEPPCRALRAAISRLSASKPRVLRTVDAGLGHAGRAALLQPYLETSTLHLSP